MKGKQMVMDSLLREADWNEKERKKQEWAREKERTDRITAEMDRKYKRADYWKLKGKEYPEGSVVIIGQDVFRNDHYTRHFYRTVMIYHPKGVDCCRAFFVESGNDEFPERPPWADTVGHEDDPRDIDYYPDMIHWITGEVVEPVRTYWMKRCGS